MLVRETVVTVLSTWFGSYRIVQGSEKESARLILTKHYAIQPRHCAGFCLPDRLIFVVSDHWNILLLVTHSGVAKRSQADAQYLIIHTQVKLIIYY